MTYITLGNISDYLALRWADIREEAERYLVGGLVTRSSLAALEAARGDRGASAVEFAIIAPIFIVLVFGIINFGALFGQQLALNSAVREGARAAVVQSTGQGANVPDLVRRAVNGVDEDGKYIPFLGLDPNTVAVTDDTCLGNSATEPLSVRADYTADLLAPMPIPGFPNSFDLSAEAIFRCEW